MKAIVVVDQRGIPTGVFLTRSLSKEELSEVRAEAERYKRTAHYIDCAWQGDPCPFSVMIEKVRDEYPRK